MASSSVGNPPHSSPPVGSASADIARPAQATAQIDWEAVDVVMLDMDGTILDLAYDTHFWHELVPQHYAQHHGLSLEAAREALTPMFTQWEGQLQWYCLDHWAGMTQLDLMTLKRNIRERIRPLAGAVDFLDAVRASGRPLWLVTNAHPGSWQLKLEHTALQGHFDEIVCSHTFGAPKEQAGFWSRFQTQHPFNSARALFVDDSLPVLRAAQRHGIGQVVAIRAPDTSRPSRIIDEFASVEKLADLLPIRA